MFFHLLTVNYFLYLTIVPPAYVNLFAFTMSAQISFCSSKCGYSLYREVYQYNFIQYCCVENTVIFFVFHNSEEHASIFHWFLHMFSKYTSASHCNILGRGESNNLCLLFFTEVLNFIFFLRETGMNFISYNILLKSMWASLVKSLHILGTQKCLTPCSRWKSGEKGRTWTAYIT